MAKFDKEIFDGLKKGDSIKITYDSSIQKGKETLLIVKSKNLVGKGKSYESEKITFINKENPNGVKYYAYQRKDGSVGFAIGDMAISNVHTTDKMAKGGGINSAYKIVKGYDHYNSVPLYQVVGVEDNDYVGEYHKILNDAKSELKELSKKLKEKSSDGIKGYEDLYGEDVKKLYYKNKKMKNGGNIDETPKVYIADLAAYNEGKLVGEWIDLSDYNDGSEVMDEISNLLKKWSKKAGEEREEYAVHDYENFASNLYSEYMGEESFDKVIKAYKVSEEKGIPADVIGTIMREYNPDDIEEWIDEHYEGQFDNDTDLAYHYVDMMGGVEKLGKKTTDMYFDYEKFGRDLAINDFNEHGGYYFRNYKKGGNIKSHDLTMYVFKNTSAYTIGGL